MDVRRPYDLAPEREHPSTERVITTLLAGFMVVFLVSSFFISLRALSQLRAEDRNWLNGEVTANLEQNFATRSDLRGVAETVWGGLRYRLFNEGRKGLLVGSEGWLFSAEEFAEVSPAALSANVTYMDGVRAYLRAQGIDLVVALVPTKAELHPKSLGRYHLPANLANRYEATRTLLAEYDLPAPDLRAGLRNADEPTFFKTDTHWTPYGADQAALALAAHISAQQAFEGLGESSFEVSSGERQTLRGDLLTFLPLGEFELLGPKPEYFTLTETRSAGGDLFGTPDIPLALVGTSYSADERWNFAGALKAHLGADLLNAAEPGGGPFAPMGTYLQSAAFGSTPPKLVVWEVPVRYLGVPYDLPDVPQVIARAN